jgi:hypothetical protein
MSRLYLRFYFALLGSLFVFAFVAGCVWHLWIAPAHGNGTAERLLQNALAPATATTEQQQASLRNLVDGIDADVVLQARDGTRLATVGGPLTVDDARAVHPAHSGAMVWALRLPDGRRLLASVPIIHGPMPRKFIFESFRWLIPGRCMTLSIFCIQVRPVMRTSSRTKVWSPQKVRKIFVGTPLAAAVEARISDAQVFSRSPL